MFGSKDALIFNRKPCNPQKAEMLSQINGLPRISIAWAPPEPLRYFCGFEVLIVVICNTNISNYREGLPIKHPHADRWDPFKRAAAWVSFRRRVARLR